MKEIQITRYILFYLLTYFKREFEEILNRIIFEYRKKDKVVK